MHTNLVGQPIHNPIVILACDCGAVALQESPAKSDGQPVRWQKAAPAICPDCLARALRRERRPRGLCSPAPGFVPSILSVR
jgi:hypothetical protein